MLARSPRDGSRSKKDHTVNFVMQTAAEVAAVKAASRTAHYGSANGARVIPPVVTYPS